MSPYDHPWDAGIQKAISHQPACRRGSYWPGTVRSSTLPARVSNTLPPLCLTGVASGIAAAKEGREDGGDVALVDVPVAVGVAAQFAGLDASCCDQEEEAEERATDAPRYLSRYRSAG